MRAKEVKQIEMRSNHSGTRKKSASGVAIACSVWVEHEHYEGLVESLENGSYARYLPFGPTPFSKTRGSLDGDEQAVD